VIKRSWLNVTAIPALGIWFIGVICISEWINIGIVADPEMISRYYFGGEAMMAHGGWHYASASLYAWTSLIQGTCLLVLGIFTFWTALQAQGRNTAIGWAVFFAWFIITQLSMHAV
jgi:hypothetical protein